ncbi:MAG: AAA family ATPase [Clostridiales bacterium]|nr:AAA family ATPase [Clostridiales bacterium]
MDYKKAIQKITQQRRAKEAAAEVLYLELLRSSPSLYEVEKAIRNTKMDIRKGKIVDSSVISALEEQREKILNELGVTHEMLAPPYSCTLCKDTGLVGGKPCSCAIALCTSDGMNNVNANFENADLSVFPQNEQERISQIYSTCKIFCQKFPTTKRLNIMLVGKCGTGKTYLASCIANELAKKGHSVIMLSSFALSHRMLKYHTTFDSERFSYIDPLLDCDLLVIDDLGSENILKNITVEYLFHIINERMTANKHTVFTTNLDNDLILSRYGERIYSRLFGTKQTIGLSLSDTDLRK